MTHSTNFNFSQWAKSDRIQMADFNADNSKIEAALTRALVEPRLIKTVTLTEQRITNDISLADIDWGAWSLIGLELPYCPGSGNTAEISIHANTGMPASYCTKDDKLGLMCAPINPLTIVLLLMRDPERYVSAVSFIPGGGYGYNPSLQYKNLTQLRMVSGTTSNCLPAGQKIYVWGIR